jgi:hypothetical protein
MVLTELQALLNGLIVQIQGKVGRGKEVLNILASCCHKL